MYLKVVATFIAILLLGILVCQGLQVNEYRKLNKRMEACQQVACELEALNVNLKNVQEIAETKLPNFKAFTGFFGSAPKTEPVSPKETELVAAHK